jgi:transposase
VRADPWETGFVDIAGDQALLGQVDGRTSAAVRAWLAARTPEFRAGIEVVVIDPHAGYAAAVRAALPGAVIAVDHFHLIMLANRAVTAVRQRVTRDLLGRRGRKVDPAWANRRGRHPTHPRHSTQAGRAVMCRLGWPPAWPPDGGRHPAWRASRIWPGRATGR